MRIPKKVWDRSIQSWDELKGKVYMQTMQGVRGIFIRRDRFERTDYRTGEVIYRTKHHKIFISRGVKDGHLVCFPYSWLHSDLEAPHPMFKNYWYAYSYHLRLKRGGKIED